MTIFVTSDTHFNHANIIRYCNRPFKDLDHMREMLITNWNSVVQPTDVVYHLGDFAMGGSLEVHVPAILARLNGNKHLVVGNHDNKKAQAAAGWASVSKSISTSGRWLMGEWAPEDTRNDFVVLLRHYNPEFTGNTWEGKENGSVLLHGHSHGNSHGRVPQKNAMDIGVDVWNYTPIPITKAIIEAMK